MDVVESLTIFADLDPSMKGERSARECITRWKQAGRDAWGFLPPISKPGENARGDYNDLVN